MSTVELPQAEHRPMPSDEYHALDDVIGSGMLECFRDSRRKFHAIYVAKTMPKPKATPTMQLGTLVHLKLLEPFRFGKIVAEPFPAVAPDGKKWLRREGSDHARWWQDEIDKRAGLIACDEETLDRVDAIVAAVKGNHRAAQLLEQDGQAEYPIFWIDKDSGLECKCMVDWFAPIKLDIKTTCDPSPKSYARSLVELGYHRKLAHYQCGLDRLCGERTPFVHIAAGTSPPYCVACYEVDDRDRSGFPLGIVQRRRMLYQLAECYESNDWREPWEKQVVTLELPAWAFQEEQWQY